MTDDFSDIKVGDEVGFYPRWNDPYVGTVTKVTPTCFDVGSRRFNKKGGRERGSSTYHTEYAQRITPEFRRAMAESQEVNSRKALAQELEPKLYKLPLSALEQIQAIVSEHEEAKA